MFVKAIFFCFIFHFLSITHVLAANDTQASDPFSLSQSFLFTENESSFEQIIDFLSQWDDWPQRNALLIKAEAMLDKADLNSILRWYKKNKPVTSNGYKYHYLAALKLIKDTKQLQEIARKAWIYGDLSKKEEKYLLTCFQKTLDQKDHVQKVERYLWLKNIKKAKEYIVFLTKEHQDIFSAWIAMLEHNNEQKFHKLKSYNNGVIYTYLLRHKNDTSIPLRYIKKLTNDLDHENEIWTLRSYFIRELMDMHNFKGAYEVAKRHGIKDDITMFAEAETLCGWLAFRKLGAADVAVQHFKNAYDISVGTRSITSSAYWLGRIYSSKKNLIDARKWYKNAAQYGYTYYGQLAQHELGYRNLSLNQVHISKKDQELAKKNKYYNILMNQRDRQYYIGTLYTYFEAASKRAKTTGEILYIFKKLSHDLQIYAKVELSKILRYHGVYDSESLFPTPITRYTHDPLVHAIILNESSFRTNFISVDGGIGTMQLMPLMAKNIAEANKLVYNKKRLMEDTGYNIKIGIHYIDHIRKKVKDSYIVTIASHNASFLKVRKWEIYNSTQGNVSLYDMVDYIEMIPFKVTRNYVKNVIENMQVYRTILNRDHKLFINTDLCYSKVCNACS